MKKLFFAFILLLSVNAFSQLKKVSDFKNYDGSAPFLEVSDTLQGGFFNPYIGNDAPDDAMVFSDKKGNKWRRVVTDNKLKIRWYGLKPYNNYGERDDAAVIRKAIAYIQSHKDQFNTLQMDLCGFNEWYFIASTVYLDGIILEGIGVNKRPSTLFQVAWDVTAFRIPAGGGYVGVKNVGVKHYGKFPQYTDSNNHSFDIHTVVDFENVSVFENPNGDGFHLDACAYADPTDTVRFGNADQSRFTNCFADMSINGFWINGCDANVISFMDCSASSNYRWGVYDNGLLGNKYFNLHLANNGKGITALNTGARVKIPPYSDTSYRTWFLREDVGDASIGKRPDLHPELWYQNDTGLGGNTFWDSTKKYYTGGGVWACNPNAKNVFIGTYTESYSPANLISARSSWSGGLDGAMVIGGVQENVFGGYKFFTSNSGANIQQTGGIFSPIVAARLLRFQTTNTTNTAAEGDVVFDSPNSLQYKMPLASGRLALEGQGGTGISQATLDAAMAQLRSEIANIPTGGTNNNAQVAALEVKVAELTTSLNNKASKAELKVVADALNALTARVNALPATGNNNVILQQTITELQTIINRLKVLYP